MDSQVNLIGALLLTYFVSRLTLRLPNPWRKGWGIIFAHVLSFAAITLLAVMVHGAELALSGEHLLLYVPPQILWSLVDRLREHKLGWKDAAPISGD